jgi:hypothetical protein
VREKHDDARYAEYSSRRVGMMGGEGGAMLAEDGLIFQYGIYRRYDDLM